MKHVKDRIRELKLDILEEGDTERIVALGEALSNQTRLRIMRYMQKAPFVKDVPTMSAELGIPKSTLVHHLAILEKAALVRVFYKSSARGAVRLVSRNLQTAFLRLYHYTEIGKRKETAVVQTLGVGQYADYQGAQLCFATDTALFTQQESSFSRDRFDAQLIYTTDGIVTYHFSNAVARREDVSNISFSFEICSEAPFFDNSFLSDVTFWINGIEVATYTCPGDFGDRRGRLTPDWWLSVNTQYGDLVTLTVNEDGTYLNGTRVSSRVTIGRLALAEGNKTVFALGNKVTAEHRGGFNLFGKGFGDYPQDICMQISYREA